jgi:hypothetical protein
MCVNAYAKDYIAFAKFPFVILLDVQISACVTRPDCTRVGHMYILFYRRY